jgi:hypothetical protein
MNTRASSIAPVNRTERRDAASSAEAPSRADLPLILRRNFGAILANALTIIETPTLYFTIIPNGFLAVLDHPESGPIPVGRLLQLWSNGKWIERCYRCRGALYVIGASGNTRTGNSATWGICADCATKHDGNNCFCLGTVIDLYAELLRPLEHLSKRMHHVSATDACSMFDVLLKI